MEGAIGLYLDQLDEEIDFDFEDDHPFKHGGLAAGFLLQMPYQKGVIRLVLEGAPGQGKSTVTQFLCQVNRLKLLPARRSELESVAFVHSSASTRTPFRIDLRDFAAWVVGRHPYAKPGELTPPEEGQRSLESFLTMQIGWNSGGLNLSQHQLLEFFERSHSVVVLDGFDEVADISTRARVVEEICSAANRLEAHALSIQIIVTSRPAAFANSPGFPEEDWTHLELVDLKWPNILQYKDKWSEAQDLTDGERNALTTTLKEKIRQPHLRELARNPMQLAILLQLMHVQGAALPDKRTALYEEYMKIFLNREVEKKQIAGDHRELILSLHGLLAWVLQIQAETGQGSGSITKEALRTEVANYLIDEEFDPNLADTLLTGTVERVGALVSRVQGMFEFEVQPLREYFAARHLYKTAPNSPPGRERGGTRPDRFSALANSSYWTNVTRFYCGFYDKGELPSLVDGLMNLSEAHGYKLVTRPRRLALMLLSDYVFTQSPRSMRRLIEFIGKEPNFERLLASDFGQNQIGMSLPETAGGKLIFEVCKQKLQITNSEGLAKAFRQAMARNGDREKIREYWYPLAMKRKGEIDLLSEARDLELVDELTFEEVSDLSKDNLTLKVAWLLEANKLKDIIFDPVLCKHVETELFNINSEIEFDHFYRDTSSSPIVVLSELLSPEILSEYFMIWPDRIATGYGRRDFFRQNFIKGKTKQENSWANKSFLDFVEYVVELMEIHPEVWRSELEPWEKLVDRGFEESPNSRLFTLISMISTAVSGYWKKLEDAQKTDDVVVDIEGYLEEDRKQGRWDGDGFHPTTGMVRRLYFAKDMGSNVNWWRDKITNCEGEAQIACLAMLSCWGKEEVIKELSSMMCSILDSFDHDRWSWFYNLASMTISIGRPQMKGLEFDWEKNKENLTERLAVVLIRRLSDKSKRRAIARKYFHEYRGGDRWILQTAAEWELFSKPYSDIDWEFAKQFSKQARNHGVEYLYSHGHAQRRIEVPQNIAEEVLTECSSHNWQFVSLCERSLESYVSKQAESVSKISEEEGWFYTEE